MMSRTAASYYVAGGTMGHDAPSYVERHADRELFEALLTGEFCYLLTPRQMGKSSLIIRTRRRLLERQIGVVLLDLSMIGQQVTPEQWYYGLLFEMGRQSGLEDELERFFERRSDLGLCHRFFAALTEVLLPRAAASPPPDSSGRQPVRLVVFVDELDVVRSLQFATDEFFAAIRGCYNRRAQEPALRQVGFALLGVATPADLIRDVRISPFNIGRRIPLRDFSREEAGPLEGGLGHPELARPRLNRILHWTGGHPYLTQRLCQAVAESPWVRDHPMTGTGADEAGIDRMCLELFLSRQAREEDDNLIFVRESVLRSETDRTALLELYRRVKLGSASVPDDHTNPLVNVLHLSGLVGSDRGYLRERNRVYARAFDQTWIDAMLPGAEVRRQRQAFRRGMIRASGVAGVILVVIVMLTWGLVYNRSHLLRINEQNRSTTVRLAVANGVSHLAAGDWFTASLWFAQAFVLDHHSASAPDPGQAAATHQLRLQSLFDRAPSLDQVWFGLARPARSGGFTSDGREVLLALTNGHALFDLATGRQTTPILGHQGTFAALSPNDRWAVIAFDFEQAPGPFTVWDVQSGTRLRALREETGDEHLVGRCRDLRISTDGQLIIAVLDDAGVGIWEADGGRCLRWWLQEDLVESEEADSIEWVLVARFDATAERVAIATTRGRVLVWNWQTPDPPLVIQAHDSWVYSAAFAPWDSNLLLTCSFDRTARLWDLDSGLRLLQVGHEGDAIRDVAFNRTQRWFATAGWDLAVRLWDTSSGQPVAPILRDRGRTMQVLFHPDDKRLLTCSWDGEVRFWDLRLNTQLQQPTACSFSADGRLALECRPHQLRFLDAATGYELAAREFHPATTLKWAVFAGRTDRALVRLEHTDPGPSTRQTLQFFDGLRSAPVTEPFPCPPGLTNLVWSWSSGHFAAVQKTSSEAPGADVAWVWEPDGTGAPWRVARSGESIQSIALNPDGAWLAVVSQVIEDSPPSTHLRVHPLDASRTSIELFRTRRELAHVAFSPDGAWLAAAETDSSLDHCSLRLWLRSPDGLWQEAEPLPHLDGVLYFQFTADSQLLATCSEDQTAIIWRRAGDRWRPWTQPLRADGQVISCAFSSDQAWLATICRAWSPARRQHARAQLWDVAHGEPIGLPYELPASRHYTVQFVADDRRLLAMDGVSGGGWLLELPTSADTAERLLSRAELLSGQHSFLPRESGRPTARALPRLSPEDVLGYGSSLRRLRPLTEAEYRERWFELARPPDP